MVPGLLVECGLPDVRLWYSTVKRGAQTLPAVKVILHEIAEVRNMRKQNPGESCDALFMALMPVTVSECSTCSIVAAETRHGFSAEARYISAETTIIPGCSARSPVSGYV